MTHRIAIITMVCSGVLLSAASRGFAQTTPLAELGSDVFTNILVSRTPAGTGVIAHTPVFLGDPTVTNVTDLINRIHEQVGTQATLFPIGSSSGGFTYNYDSAIGTFSRTTQTFGPSFAERAETIGRGRFSFGMNYLHSSYDSLDSKDLENGDIRFYLLHQPLAPASFVEGDVIEAALTMKITDDTMVWYGNYGVTNSLDIGVAVPISHVSMDIMYHATIRDFATRVVSPTTHVFANGSKTADFRGSGSASGIGDTLIQAKYSIPTNGPVHVAAAVGVRVPSGDSENLLGSGATLTRFLFVASGTGGSLSPHVNVGYTVSSGGDANVPDQVNYIGGVEYGASPRLTIVGDLIGRTVRNSFRLTAAQLVHPFRQGDTAPLETVTLNTVDLTAANLNTFWATGGFKLNPWRNLLVAANLMVPVTDAGLRSRITPTFGFEFTF